MRISIILLLAALAVMAFGAVPSVLYVSPRGNDRNPGTRERPFATLARARDALRVARLGNTPLPAGGVTILVEQGHYYLDEPLTFGPEDGGAPGQWISYDGDDGAIITGGRRITGWSPRGEGLWAATVDGAGPAWQPRQLLYNGEPRPCVRWPREGFFQGIASEDGIALTFPPDRFPRGDTSGGELTMLVEWTTSHQPLNRARIAGSVATFPACVLQFIDQPWAAHIKRNISAMPYYFENLAETPLAPGEWRWDGKANELLYRARPGEIPAEAEITVPWLTSLLRVEGEAGRPVRCLEFRNLTFTGSDFQVPAAGFMPGQAGMTAPPNAMYRAESMPAAITFRYAEGCGLSSCRLLSPGGAGVSLERGCRSCSVAGCTIDGAGGNGIQVGGPHPFPPPGDLVSEIGITHNVIRRCGALAHGSVGIWVGIASHAMIMHNDLYDLPYSGISVGWDWSHRDTAACRNEVIGNHIHDVLQLLADGGGVYTLGKQPDSELVGNLIHDAARRSGVAPVNGIFMDQGSEGWLIENNIVYAVADGPLRYNDSGPAFQQLGKNYFGVAPTDPAYPKALAEQAGAKTGEQPQ